MKKISESFISFDKIIVSCLFIVVVLTGFSIFTYFKIEKLSSQNILTHNLIISLRSVRKVINEAQTGERGYLLTRQSKFLKVYNEAIGESREVLDHFNTLLISHPEYKKESDNIEALFQDTLRGLVEVNTLSERGYVKEAIEIVALGQIETKADLLRSALDLIEEKEEAKSEIRSHDLKKSSQLVVFYLLLGFLSSLTFLMMFAFKAKNEIKEKNRAKKMADNANNAKSLFLANISHEIRTPLNGVIGLVSLLKKTDLNAEQKGYVNNIDKSGNMLLHLINDILDFSKIESGHVDVENVSFELAPLFEDLKNNFRYLCDQKKINLLIQFPNIDFNLIGDEKKLRQILLNLLGNAIKFTQTGAVVLNASLQEENQDEAKFIFQVTDTGIGISMEDQKKLFKNFSQANTTISRKYGGTGLGLAITKRFVELMGGGIEVLSEEGKGAIFTFKLKFKKTEKKATAQNLHPTQIKITPQKILLVEDNVINQIVVTKLLEKYNHQIEVANDGQKALEVLKKKNFDVVLMDCQMPNLDGFATTKAIREGKSQVPIIALTANAYQSEREKCFSVGMNGFLTKPVDENLLVNEIQKFATTSTVKQVDKSDTIINLDSLNKIKMIDGDSTLLYQLINIFLKTAPHKLDLIKQYIETSNIKKAREEAHSLKSSAYTLAADKLGEICQKIEDLSDEDAKSDVLKFTLLKSLQVNYQATEKYLSGLLNETAKGIVNN